MNVPMRPASIRAMPNTPIPHDVKRAIEFMRRSACEPVSMVKLVRHCGVAERTLNKHFHAFLQLSPMQYLRRLRLAATREFLLAGDPAVTVTEAAKRYCFNHVGRFAYEYRLRFGESPSATLRRARRFAASPGEPKMRRSFEREFRPHLPSRERPSIAILPCRAAANEPALQWLAESVADAIAAVLTQTRALAVKVAAPPRAAGRDPERLARELYARYFLTGKVMRSGGRLRFILHVADAATGEHVWGDSFDGDPAQPLEFQDRVVAGVTRVISPRIRGAEIDRVQRALPENLDAYGLAMRALPYVFASRAEASLRALELLNRAIEIDPDFGLAAALAGWCHGQLVMYNGTPTPREDTVRALQLVRRAAILVDDDPVALTAQCAVHTMASEFDLAEALVARALAIDPLSGWAWGRSGWLHSYRGNTEAAIEHFGRALTLDLDLAGRANSFAGIGSAHFGAGCYARAAFWLRRALHQPSGPSWPNRTLSVAYARIGERSKALDSLDSLRRSYPDLNVGRVVAALPFRSDYLDRLADGLSELGLPT
jgi:TolB-like protein